MDLNALKQAMAPIMQVGKKEIEFDVEGTRIVLRPLLPVEEVAVQKYAASVLDTVQRSEGLTEEDQMSRAAALDYFDRFRIEVISYSVVEVGGLSLRGVESVETGEFLDNGTPVRMPRFMAMRGIVEQWSRAMITICFAKYGDMVRSIAEEAEKMVEKSQADMEAEIERLEERLSNLKSERETRAAGDPSITSKQIDNLVKAGKAISEQIKAAKNEVEMQENYRKPVYPDSSPPPTAGPEPVGSFFDPTVEEVGEQNPNLLDEANRLAEARRSALREQDLVSQATPIGEIDGVEAYRLPSVDMSPRGKKSAKSAALDKKNPKEGTENPNFKPPR